MNTRAIQCSSISAILLFSTFATVMPSMGQLSPARDVTGVWKGTATWTDSFDYYPSAVSCSFTSDVELDLTQDGTSFGGSIFYTNIKNTQASHNSACDTVAHPPGPQIAYGQISISSFSGTIYDGVPIQGSFTTDLISGTIKGSNGAQKWDLTFKAERQGAPTPPPSYQATQAGTSTVQTPASGSLKTDQPQYQLSREHTTPVTITGKVQDGRGDRVILTITKPDGYSDESYAFLTNTGNFESIYDLDKSSPVGQYQLTVTYNGMAVGSTSFAVSYQQAVTGAATPAPVHYLLYKNDDYGFSIEYPSNWIVVNHFEEESAVVGAAFSPNKSLEFDVGVQKNNNPFAGMVGQQVLDSITTLLKNRCSSATLQATGYRCTPGQYSQNTISYQGMPAYLVVGGWTKTFADGTTAKWLSEWFVIPNGSDVWLLVIEMSADDFKTYGNEISHMGDSFSIYGASQANVTPAEPYSNYSLQQGEWVKYKMHLDVSSNNATMQRLAQDQMSKSFSSMMGQQLGSLDDIDWMKYTITSVSPTDIMTHGEMQVLGRHVDLGDASLGQSTFAAIPTTAKVGDTFDSPLSTPQNPSKVTLTAITQENVLGQDVKVFELTSHETAPGEGATSQADQVLHYDAKTGILLDWTMEMKVYSSSLFVNMKFTMVPTDWSQAPAAPSYVIPGWVKNSAKWWAQGQLSDSEFVKGIQYLVQQGIITVPQVQPASQPSQGIPAWVKNTAKWWSEGQLSDSDFVKGVQYLVEAGIISTTPQVSVPSEQVTYTNRDGTKLTVSAVPNQVLLFVKPGTSQDDVNQMVSNNGGQILSQESDLGYYQVQTSDVSNFITSSFRYSFVLDAFPNEIQEEYQQPPSSPNIPGYIDLTQTKWNNVAIPPGSKVMLVQIDDFVYGRNECGGQTAPHGVCVSKENNISDGTNGGVTVLKLQDKHGDKIDSDLVIKNIQQAMQIAKKYKQKLVINLSLGVITSDDNGNVYSDAQQRVKANIEHYLDAVMSSTYFQSGNVIISQAAPDDHIDLGRILGDLQGDPHYGQAFKSYITTSQVKRDENGNQILTTFVHGATSAYGNGVVFVNREDNCGGGTSCAVYGTSATQAYLWSWYPNMTSSQMVNLIKSNSATPSGGTYPVVNIKNAFLAAWEKFKCAAYCPNYGQSDNGINQLHATQPQTQNQPPATQGQQTYGGYSSPQAYCQGTYGSGYYYDSSRNVCAPTPSQPSGGTGQQTGGGSSGINLTGRWAGSARGVINISSAELSCSYSATVSMGLTQSGSHLGGPVSVNNISLSGEGCEAAGFENISGQLSATIFGSGFSGTVDILQVNGQFTSDLMRGTYSGGSGDYTISGDFTASRVG